MKFILFLINSNFWIATLFWNVLSLLGLNTIYFNKNEWDNLFGFRINIPPFKFFNKLLFFISISIFIISKIIYFDL